MEGIYVLTLALTAVVALLSIPIFYIWAWAMGPAVRYLARRAAEGWFEVADRHARDVLKFVPMATGVRHDVSPPHIEVKPSLARPEETAGKPDNPGHRWLDDTR